MKDEVSMWVVFLLAAAVIVGVILLTGCGTDGCQYKSGLTCINPR